MLPELYLVLLFLHQITFVGTRVMEIAVFPTIPGSPLSIIMPSLLYFFRSYPAQVLPVAQT